MFIFSVQVGLHIFVFHAGAGSTDAHSVVGRWVAGSGRVASVRAGLGVGLARVGLGGVG